LFVQLHVQSLNQLQQMAEATRCALAHLSELGVEMIEEMTPELEAWCNDIDAEDEESFQRHPVLHQPPMTDPVDAIGMHVMNAMVRMIRQQDQCSSDIERRSLIDRSASFAVVAADVAAAADNRGLHSPLDASISSSRPYTLATASSAHASRLV
jgi:hypothetical protein